MTPLARRLAWLPPAAVGASAAVCAELAVGMLLYVRGGFFAALTLVLCAEAAALAFGLWSAPVDDEPPWSGVRRAWFLLLAALVARAAVAASWEALGGLSGTWLQRGLGLAFLATLPLYAAGAVLGAPALAHGEPPVRTGPWAAAGAVGGFALVGVGSSLLRLAPLAYDAGILLVAVAALVHGRLLEERGRRWLEARGGTVRELEEAPPAPLSPGPGSLSAPPHRPG